jgi:hypothetical protein
MEALITFEGQEFPVRKDKDGNVCLTDLWRLSGSDESMTPSLWQRQDQAIGFIKAASALLKYDLKSLFKSSRGRNGSTYAHPLIAVEYAGYLDPTLAVAANQAFLERIEEEKNPDLIGERYVRTWKKKGKDDAWIGDRFQGITTRNILTATLKRHGVQNDGYKNATNAIYGALYGGTSDVVREKKGLTRKDKIRDNLPRVELRAIELAEMLTAESIEINQLEGNAQCEMAAVKAGKLIAGAIIHGRER